MLAHQDTAQRGGDGAPAWRPQEAPTGGPGGALPGEGTMSPSLPSCSVSCPFLSPEPSRATARGFSPGATRGQVSFGAGGLCRHRGPVLGAPLHLGETCSHLL